MIKSINLGVPHVGQPLGFGWCCAASAAMILKWYGEKISQQRIAREMPVSKREGVSVGIFGEYFLKKGYDVLMKFWLPGMRPRDYGLVGSKSNVALIRALDAGLKQYEFPYTRQCCVALKYFIDLGGTICLEPPLLCDIEHELVRRRPLIFIIDSNLLNLEGRTVAPHMVVVNGLQKRSKNNFALPDVIYHDPRASPNMIISSDKFLYSCHNCDGLAIFIKPAGTRSGKPRL